MAGMDQFLQEIRLKRNQVPDFRRYPFSIPAVRKLEVLELNPRVTFFVGDNGTGKSTLLEAVAVNFGFNPEGGSRNFAFSTYASHSCLSEYLLLVKGARRPRDGYFFRAESFYNVATNIEELDAGPGLGGPPISASYGGNLHERSHGESFFALLNNRLGGDGLYLFDEPEAALSPLRQLSMLCRLKELTDNGSQCLIATHSPILMSFPGSTIYQFSQEGVQRQRYEETDQFRITRDFLNRYPQMLAELFSEEPEHRR